MKRLMFGLAGVTLALMVGCTTPVRVRATGSDGTVREIEVRDASGKPLEVGSSVQEKIDKVVPSVENEIVKVLKSKASSKDYAEKYEINCDAVVAAAFAEPLTAEEKSVIDQVIQCLIKKYVEDIIYPAWAEEISKNAAKTAREALQKGDYAGARECIWGFAPCGVTAVDALARKSLEKILNEEINIAQWKEIEKVITEKFHALLKARKYADATSFVKAYPAIRTYSQRLKTEPTASPSDSIDSEKALGVLALNKRLTNLKEQLLGELKTAKRAEFDAKMQAKMDGLVAQVIELVRAKSFDKARKLILDFGMTEDAEWNAKFYVTRIGLLNSAVNPNQLETLKIETGAKIDGLLNTGKRGEAETFVKNYPYVHDVFSDIFGTIGGFRGVMKSMKIEDKPTADYLDSLRVRIVETLEKREGAREDELKTNDALEKALAEFGKTYIAQYFDENVTTSLTATVRKEILMMASCLRPAMTTWEMNEALKLFLEGKLTSAPESNEPVAAEQAPVVLASVPEYDEQIALAEGAIAAAHFKLEAVMGDYARIMRNLKKGATPSKEEWQTVLVGAVVLNQRKFFDLAQKNGVDIVQAPRRDLLKRPALLVAIEMGRYQFVEALSRGKSAKVVDAQGNTALHYAVNRGSMTLIRTFATVVDPKAVNGAGETVLFTAVRRNQLAAAQFIIALVGDKAAQKDFVNHRNGDQQTAFGVACTANSHMLLDTLADAGATYDETDLGVAAKNNCVGAAQWLVEKGLDVNDKRVLDAVADDNGTLRFKNEVVDYLLQEGLKPELKKPEQNKPEQNKPEQKGK